MTSWVSLSRPGRPRAWAATSASSESTTFSAYWTPALTTIRMDFAGLGRACVAAVAAELDGRPRPEVMLTARACT
jgi:DNA-binding LacI/PurR family transcriptional regulator